MANGTLLTVIDPHGDALPRVLIREKPDGTITRYVYGIGLLYEVDESDEATHYHFDQSGSTIALTDSSGAVSDRVEYSPFGTVTHRIGTTDTPYLYAGQFGIQQEANGLLHMRARYYSPELERFVSSDPARFDGGLNWYAYANNSPLLFIDPTGLFFGTPLTFSEFVGAAVSGAAHGAAVFGKGLAIGIATGAVVAGGAAAAVAVGVPTAVVTGALFTGAVIGGGILAIDTIQDPSLDNITYNAGLLTGGLFVGELGSTQK